MVGVEAAGKVTILQKLKLGERVTSITTIGFNVGERGVQELLFHRVARRVPRQVPPSAASSLPRYERSDPHGPQQRSKPGRGCQV